MTPARAAPTWMGEAGMFMRIAAAASLAALAAASFAVAQPAAQPNDAQIAHIAYTAGLIDIATAKQALAKSKNPKVREFAEEMVRDHGAVNDKALALVKKLGVTPQDNPTSQSLAEIEGEKRADQAKLSGHAFDVAYAANEVAYHRMVDNALEQTLIPDARNGELKSLLQTGLKLFQMHEQHAEQLVADLK
jgi:putative membrane protein